jgi:alcohol dehydrogenase
MHSRPIVLGRHARNLLSPSALPASQAALERNRDQRVRRLLATAGDSARQRLRPTRPRMRSLVVTPSGRMRWRSVASPPPPGPLAAVVHPIAIATCDMDRPIALGATPFPMPMCFGHECVAEVVRVGSEVESVRSGDRVVVPFQISCGSCDACRGGHTSNCLSVPPISMYGFGLAGGHWGGAVADELAVPFADGMLVKLPEGIDPLAAASVADNVSDAHRHIAPHLPAIIEQGREPKVVIVGALSRRHLFTASVAMYAGQIAAALGATEVVIADARPEVRDQVTELGLHAVTPRELRGIPATALVMDASATPKGTRLAVSRTAPDGVCSSVGGLHSSVKLPMSTMYGRNVSLHVARSHARAVIPEVLALMAAGRLEPERVTTVIAPIDEAPAALAEHMRGASTKTILDAT